MKSLRSIMKYLNRIYKAVLGIDIEPIIKTEVQYVGFNTNTIDDLNKNFPIKVHVKGMSLEEHTIMGGEQRVIQYLYNKVTR